MKIRENVLLSSLTTMRLGGPARYVLEVENESEIPEAYAFAEEKNLPVFVLGGGANTIAHDEGFDGVIIKSGLVGIEMKPGSETGGRNISFEGPKTWASAPERPEKEIFGQDPFLIQVYSGTIWDDVVEYAVERGLTGIEALSKIPGLAGAAPVQNIGAYGQDIAAVLDSARVYDTKSHEFKTLTNHDFHFSYRHSIMNTTEKNRYFVVSITLALRKGQMPRPFYNSIERYISENNCTDFSPSGIRKIVSAIRADKLPDPAKKASAGSFFKNVYLSEKEAAAAEAKGYPVYKGHDGLKINSGWLIEQTGLKGALLHGFRINDKAALVLINESATGYADLAAARAEIISAVRNKFDFTLEQEPEEISVTRTGDASAGGPPNQRIRGKADAAGPVRSRTKLLNGRELAGFIKERQAHEVRSLNKKPHLLIIRDSDNPVIAKYVNLKIKYGEDIGVKVSDYLAKDSDDIRDKILEANKDPEIDGIILQLPIVDKDQTDALTSLIAPTKDVDGLSGHGDYDSATATAINWLLAGYNIELSSKSIAIVGRGKLVGAPLFKMFTNSGYQVELFHRGSDLTKLNQYDIIITATGVPGLIVNSYVRPGAVIVDAGTASEKGILKGDVADEVRARTDLTAITPVVGGVGPLTVTCLFDHVIQAAKKSQK